jgi:DNA polymerase III alpha subunit
MDAKMTSIEGCENMSATEYYMDVRCGNRQVEYIHPDLEYILKDSNGVFVYQEEIMKFLVDIVGYTLEESDIIRSAIAKKKHDVMMASFDKIREATEKRGWTKAQQDAICNAVMAFSRYSFNKSHSYAYAELGYITMYLKHHHPIEWWTAVLNNEDDEDKLRSYVSLLGDIIKPPSMKNPKPLFNNTIDSIIAPISVVKNIGPKSVEEMCNKGPFESLKDFCTRINHTKVNIGHIGEMVKARAADVFMDKNESYPRARLKFMMAYKAERGRSISSKFKTELKNLDALSIFLMEKETNKAFNKNVLSDNDVVKHIVKYNSGFIETHKPNTPLIYNNTMVFKSSDVVKKLVEEKYERPVSMVLLFNESSIKRGLSKRGKPYTLMKIDLSDGINDIEAAMWDREKPLRFEKNSFVCVVGTLGVGWKTDISINITDIKQLK